MGPRTACFLVLLQGITVLCSTELLKNHDFEITTLTNSWDCNLCTITTSQEHMSGSHGALVTNRQRNYSGARQDVNLNGGHRYNFTGFIKLQNLAPGVMYQTVELMAECFGNHGRKVYVKFGHVPYVRLGEWTEVGGIQTLPSGSHGCHVYVQVLGHQANYYVDRFSLQEVPDISDWRTEANARIDQIRKADVTIELAQNHKVAVNNLEIELIQTSHEFGFGTAVGALQMVDPNLSKYQNFVYDNFEWAVLENALKWGQMERNQGNILYDRALNAVKVLRDHGMKVRGHNVFWGVTRHSPTWVQNLSGQDLLNAMTTRINGVIGHTKGMLEHWDVNNENLHGDFFEKETGDINITMKMFRDIHALDPYAKLFLNEFGVLEKGLSTMGLKNQALLFKDAHVPIYGVGIQGHLHNAHLDITTIKARLDTVAQAGLPIWITELSMAVTDEALKAQAIKDLYTLFFSHPSVEGVLLWGFWDGKLFDDKAKLAEGSNVTPNAAGRAYQTLYKSTWRTHETHQIYHNAPVKVRGFKGNYTLNVKHNGHVIETQTFVLDNNGQNVTVHLNGTGQSPGVSQILVG